MFNNRFIVYDVETPNSHNDKMSAIGIAVIENNEIIETKYYLVNPDSYFDRFNVELTGITPAMVKDEKNFPLVWEEIKDIMSSGILVAHNARFDLGVLSKCLKTYELAWNNTVDFLCTCIMGKAEIHGTENHKLNTLAEYLDIELEHHNALSDTLACAKILLYLIKKGVDVNKYIKKFDINKIKTVK